MDTHKVRLDLRPCIDVEGRLLRHLNSLRRTPKALRIRELLEAGLGMAAPPWAVVPGDARGQEVSADLSSPNDAAVLDALDATHAAARKHALRQWLLAGYAASEAGDLAGARNELKAAPESRGHATPSSALTSPAPPPPAPPPPAPPPPAPPPPRASGSPEIDIDLSSMAPASERVVHATMETEEEKDRRERVEWHQAELARWQEQLQTRDAEGNWRPGERDVYLRIKPQPPDLSKPLSPLLNLLD